MNKLDFIRESNRIEGILREPTQEEVRAHNDFWRLLEIDVGDLELFTHRVARAPLRSELGMNVRVGRHLPPPGGPHIIDSLDAILKAIKHGLLSPWEAHVEYETLHPFMDGNGRSGRVLWAWQMLKLDERPFVLPFLHRFYYQTFDASRNQT